MQSTEERKEKARIRAAQWRLNNLEKSRLNGRKAHYRKYGLTLDQVEEMHATASGCEICGRTDRKLVIDHNHETGEVRGLLCNPCNFYVLGASEEIEYFQSVISYLTKYSAESKDLPRSS
jgi:hypothetical protein